MDHSIVPTSEVKVIARSEHEIADALEEILHGKVGYSYVEPIFGAARSGRIMSTARFGLSTPLPRPFSAREMAREIIRLQYDRPRYDPPEQSSGNKGWEIRATEINGAPTAIVWAAWCKN